MIVFFLVQDSDEKEKEQIWKKLLYEEDKENCLRWLGGQANRWQKEYVLPDSNL